MLKKPGEKDPRLGGCCVGFFLHGKDRLKPEPINEKQAQAKPRMFDRDPIEVVLLLAMNPGTASPDVDLANCRVVDLGLGLEIIRAYEIGKQPSPTTITPQEASVLLEMSDVPLGTRVDLMWGTIRLAEVMIRLIDPESDVIGRAATLTGISEEKLLADLIAVGLDVKSRTIAGEVFGARRTMDGFRIDVVADDEKDDTNIVVREAAWLSKPMSLGDHFTVPRADSVLGDWAKVLPNIPLNGRRQSVDSFESLRKLLPPVTTPQTLESYELGPLRRFHSVDHGALYAEVSGSDAWRLWQALDRDAKNTGFRPILVGGDRKHRRNAQLAWEQPIDAVPIYGSFSQKTPADALAQAASVDVAKRLSLGGNPAYPDLKPERISWPKQGQGKSGLAVFYDYENRKRSDLWLVLIPTDAAYKTAAWMRSLNQSGEATPALAELIAVSKSWEERFGARLAVIEPAVVEWVVPKRSMSRKELLALAAEHFFFAPEGGAFELENRAASLDGATSWYAWWD